MMDGHLGRTAGIILVVFAVVGCSRQPVPAPPAPPAAPPAAAAVPKGGLPTRNETEGVRPVDPYTLEYNPATEIALHGNILGVRRIPLSDDRNGVLIRVHAGGGLPWVYLGPETWVTDHCGPLEMTQSVGVTGSMIEENGQPMLIARRLETADGRTELRDELGTPYWTSPPLAASSTAQALDQRREEYLRQVLAYHEREADAIRAKLLVKPSK